MNYAEAWEIARAEHKQLFEGSAATSSSATQESEDAHQLRVVYGLGKR